MNEIVHALTPGTVLDGRYRLETVLGQGGFGITYAAEHVRVGMRVAIKELFWKGHSSRNTAVSPEVALENARDASQFEEQKDRFLREARTVRDFSSLQGIARILDYFEANGTAYIVMEFVEGETLSALLAREGKLPAEDILRRFLPLTESLSAIHQAGVIHRDISPDNIMVQPDGSLKLIDFGAARQYLTVGGEGVTAIAKDSYAPGEQYDRNGKQGPWTDVYSLCATLYTCVTGTPPLHAVQRMFLDELPRASGMVASLPPAYDAIIMKGLELEISQRWQSMGELADAIRGALPDPKPKDGSSRGLLYGALGALAVMLLVLGLWGWRQYQETHKFSGIRTVDLFFTPVEEMSALEFGEAQRALRDRVEKFAGKDAYLFRVDGVEITVTVPLETFGGQGIDTVLESGDWDLGTEHTLNYRTEIVANWEDPAAAVLPGKNQVRAESLEGRTGIFVYTCDFETLTMGQRANAIMDFKVRLDALARPYAIGTVYGHEDWIAFRMGTDRLGPFILDSIGRNGLNICGEASEDGLTISHYTSGASLRGEEAENGSFSLTFTVTNERIREELLEVTRRMLGGEEHRLYLESGRNAIAAMTVDRPITDGKAVFSELWTDGGNAFSDDFRWLGDYVRALLEDTDLPHAYTMKMSDALDTAGKTDFSGFAEEEYGLNSREKAGESAFAARMSEIAEEKGYRFRQIRSADVLFMNIPWDQDFLKNVKKQLPEIFQEASLAEACVNRTLVLILTEEKEGEQCRVTVRTNYDGGAGCRFNYIHYFLEGSERTAAVKADFETWWAGLPLREMGFSQSYWKAEE